MIPSPLNDDKTVYDDWLSDQQRADSTLGQPSLALMGTGSDYTVFFDHLGIPSIDMLFNRQGKGVYPYHSNYDSYYWLEKFGDIGFKKHLAMAQLWGVIVVRLAELSVVPFNAGDYPATLKSHLQDLKAGDGNGLDFQQVESAIRRFQLAADNLDRTAHALLSTGQNRNRMSDAISAVNNKYRLIERLFLLPKNFGLPGRPWYRHMVRLKHLFGKRALLTY